MTSWSDLSIVHATQRVKGLRLETDWLEIGRALKNLSNRMKQEKYNQLLRTLGVNNHAASDLVAMITELDSQKEK